VYSKLHESTHALAPHVKSVLLRLGYYEKKWKWLENTNRDALTLALRASLARKAYYEERAKLFYDKICIKFHELFYATLMRQRYYERKVKYLEGTLVQQETEAFQRYEQISYEYCEEREAEAEEEAHARRVLQLEEMYVQEIKDARALEEYERIKEHHALDAEEFYTRARYAIRNVRNHLLEAEHREMAMADQQDTIDSLTRERCREMMVRMGIIRNQGVLAKPALVPLPVENSVKYQFELQNYREMNSKTNAGRIVQSIENQSLTSSNEKQRVYVAKVAHRVGMQDQVGELFSALSRGGVVHGGV